MNFPQILKDWNDFFQVIHLKNFCVKYDLGYDHFRRILNGEKELSEKYVLKVNEAIEKFKKDVASL